MSSKEIALIKRIVSDAQDIASSITPYRAGLECGLYGPNETNCHFSLFSTREKTTDWERGKKAGEARRAVPR